LKKLKIRDGKTSHVHGLAEKYCENGYTTKWNLQIQCNSYQNPMSFFKDTEKSILKFIQKHKGLKTAKVILSKKSNTGGITILDFELHYGNITSKTARYWHTDMKINETETEPHSYSHVPKTYISEKKLLRQENWVSIYRKQKLDPYLSPCTKINSK
jgi:hypothetical protein